MTFDSRKPSWRDHLGKAALVALGLFVALALYIGLHEGELPEALLFLGIVAVVLTVGLGGAWLKDRKARRTVERNVARKGPPDIRPPAERGMYQ